MLAQDLLDPGAVRLLPGLQGLVGLPGQLLSGRGECLLATVAGGDHDALFVGDDDVPGVHVHAPATHPYVERLDGRLDPGERDDSPCEDRKAQLAYFGEVTDNPVEDERRDPPALRYGADVSAGERVVHVTRFDDDDRAGLGAMDRRVQHEVVTGRAAYGERRSGDAWDRRPHRPDADVHDLLTSQDIGESGGRNTVESVVHGPSGKSAVDSVPPMQPRGEDDIAPAVEHANIGRMKITVLGSCGAWPAAGEACSGFLVEHDDFRLLVDAGYATLPRLLQHTPAERIDAVLISHGHPDHCADLNPLLRARTLRPDRPEPLPVHAPPGALDAVLTLDEPGMLDDSYVLREMDIGASFEAGPFSVATRLLPHWLPNAGMRISADGKTLAYTGDTGPTPEVVTLAREADLLIAEATYAGQVPDGYTANQSSASQAGRQAADAGAAHLLLTHLWPGTDRTTAKRAAANEFHGNIQVAEPGMTVDLK